MQEKEFLELLHKEEGKLLRIAWSILGQESDAWDVLQESVEKAWSHRQDLRGGARAFPGWIRKIVVNSALNQLNFKKRIVPMETENISHEDFGPFPSPEKVLEDRDVWLTLASLSESQRQVVILRYLGDLSLCEISEELEVPLSTVKSRLYRALTRLRENWERSGAAL
ncbi:RNA polymerase sigma factor [Candidatus Contubernalis alkaliaceticus]|uniref:RNA polymerase sigma factor n=1 Tax=Candidatus Contubernalis alkaliaceticus TaxID=338645 RepID=UPI001F4C08C8|nr:RNA polymerase sigma factor [Candidatus Contubernalis alkalaceticus]UNC93154.1 RNA polymerase sigma factor [Candidatus Contubernalis alkalaceticus]